MNKKEFIKLIKEALSELSATGTGAGFSPGKGEQYGTGRAFRKEKNSKDKSLSTRLGFTKVKRPKRPSHTKLIDYLQNENTD